VALRQMLPAQDRRRGAVGGEHRGDRGNLNAANLQARLLASGNTAGLDPDADPADTGMGMVAAVIFRNGPRQVRSRRRRAHHMLATEIVTPEQRRRYIEAKTCCSAPAVVTLLQGSFGSLVIT
jgi:hypothetical protein